MGDYLKETTTWMVYNLGIVQNGLPSICHSFQASGSFTQNPEEKARTVIDKITMVEQNGIGINPQTPGGYFS